MLNIKKSFRFIMNIYSTWKGSSLNRRLLGAAVIVAVFTGMAKVIFFGKELVVAWQFGTSDMLDAFLIAYVVPSFVINLIAGSFNSALIPVYTRVREQDGQTPADALYSSVMTLSIVFLTICTGLIVLSAPYYLPILASGFDQEKTNLTLNLLYATSPVIVFSGVTTIRGAILNAGEKFLAPALIPIVTPAMTIVLIFVGREFLNIYALALGLVIGQVIESSLLGWLLKRRGIKNSLSWHGMDSNLRRVIGQFLPMVAGAFLTGSNQLVDQAFAASLPAGNVAMLGYGNKVISFPLQIAATAIGTSVFPYFSSMLAKKDWGTAKQVLDKYLKLIFLFSVPVTLVLVIFSEPLVRLLLQRGAFTAQDTETVAAVQALGALQIPFYLGGILIVRLVSAVRANRVIMWISFANMIVNIVMNYLLMKIYGVVGISLSTSIVYFVSFSMLFLSVSVIAARHQSNSA